MSETDGGPASRSRTARRLKLLHGLPNQARQYILGNGSALLIGFAACYFALFLEGSFSVRGWDFYLYYAVSHLVVDGHGSQVYSLHAVSHIEHVLAPGYTIPGGVVQNVYSPLITVALAPLAALPYVPAYFVWLAADCFALAAVLYVLEQYMGLVGRRALVFRLLAILSLPVLVALIQGQISILLLGLVTISFFALRAGREAAAGIALGLTLMKPQYALAFVVLWVVRGHWRALLAFATTAVVSILVPLPIVGPNAIGQYFHVLIDATQWGNGSGGFSPAANRGFFGFSELLFARPISTVVACALSVASLVLLVYCARKCRVVDVPFAMAVVVALLISPHVLIHDLSLLLIPVAVALRFRSCGRANLITVLAVSYIAIPVGFGLSLALPVQLSVVAMSALGIWLFDAGISDHLRARPNSLQFEYSTASSSTEQRETGTPHADLPAR